MNNQQIQKQTTSNAKDEAQDLDITTNPTPANQKVEPTNPPTIISGTSTEAEDLSVASSEPFVKHSETQPILHPEVHESGVRSLPFTPPITQDQINVGIQS